jgi:hypothetical protein
MKHFAITVVFTLCIAVSAEANTIVLYGDQDGFGVGATTFKDPLVSSAGAGEAPGTDMRLIGTNFSAPAFQPTATLLFAPQSGISTITITMSMAEFGGNINPVDGPNAIMIDGVTVPPAFLDSFSSFAIGANPNIETKSFLLPSTFFPLFADGSVDLKGTHISERVGFGSFQIDYVRFDISTVPEPSSFLLMTSGLIAVGWVLRQKRHLRKDL